VRTERRERKSTNRIQGNCQRVRTNQASVSKPMQPLSQGSVQSTKGDPSKARQIVQRGQRKAFRHQPAKPSRRRVPTKKVDERRGGKRGERKYALFRKGYGDSRFTPSRFLREGGGTGGASNQGRSISQKTTYEY